MEPLIDWQHLRNPVLEYPDYSVKDACMAYRGGIFHLFFSVFDEERSSVAMVTTEDFRRYSGFHFRFDGREDGWVGMCSPCLIAEGEESLRLTFNSWGDDPLRPNQLFYMESPDFLHWGPHRPLAPNLTAGVRAIDAALARHADRWYLLYKAEGWRVAHMAAAPALEGPWEFVGNGLPAFLMPDGRESGLTHENFQALRIDGRWHVLTTDYPPHHPCLYDLDGTGDDPAHWLRWVNGRRLEVPAEAFNTVDRDNAASLCDWRQYDGHFYLLYARKGEIGRDRFSGSASHKPWPRGWNRLALARSRDLVHWTVPPG
jgi:hypothetical protein